MMKSTNVLENIKLLPMSNEPKTGPELAALRVKQHKQKQQRDLLTLKQAKKKSDEKYKESCLIGELKAAQSDNRNIRLKDKAFEVISVGRTETIENQPNARSALRLEALL